MSDKTTKGIIKIMITKMTDKELMDHYMLNAINGLGKRKIHALLQEYKSASDILSISDKEADKIFGPKTAESFKYAKSHWDKEKEYNKMLDLGIRIIPYDDESFPNKLRTIPDPPSCIYVKGKLPDDNLPSVSIVGARMCSEYGRYVARQFGLELAQAGIQIISGMAMGVDGISQKAALKSGHPSYGVLGCSPEFCYPDTNQDIYDMLCKNGGIISEYMPGTMPQARLFPQRNRIISGLSDIVLVIEARKKSGTQITVDMALEQGKEIFAVPGRITDRLSDGCNDLIRQGAGIALAPEDIISCFTGSIQESGICEHTDSSRSSESNVRYQSLSPLEKSVLDAMDIYPISASEIAEKLEKDNIKEPVSVILQTLTMMQISGLIENQGSYYTKKIK
jgi:DNA processing protein